MYHTCTAVHVPVFPLKGGTMAFSHPLVSLFFSFKLWVEKCVLQYYYWTLLINVMYHWCTPPPLIFILGETVCTCTHTHTHTYTPSPTCTCVYTTPTHSYTHIHTYTYTCIYIHTCTCTSYTHNTITCTLNICAALLHCN